VLAFSSCFISQCDHFKVIIDFRSLSHGGIHFRFIEASQNKSDVTNRFGDRNFLLDDFTGFPLNTTVSKFFGSLVRQKLAEIHFRSMEASQNDIDVTFNSWLAV
jgi:hypothetical protein